jgi:hypothetical protein
MDNGYEEMLRALGADFTSFVQNLDALHAHLSRTYTKLVYPSFRFVKQLEEEFEGAKAETRNRELKKSRQYNDQKDKKKHRKTNDDKQNTAQITTE